ncbi:MAG: hypothetical protein D6812_02780 [Deltaproteobacteria bacterium]|nr:MAG: hypothetical protein D6812_02780 [Deltaproteobacteria bacterium]
MQEQIRDMVVYRGKTYILIGVNGPRPFDPQREGLTPIRLSQTHWRGYQCVYRVEGAKLLLDQLHITTRVVDRELFGVKPKDGGLLFTATYTGIEHEIPFSGTMLIGRGSLSSPYAHLSAHPAWRFGQVHELLFEDGILVRAEERTERMNEIRQRIASLPWRPQSSEEQEGLLEDFQHVFLRRY